MMFTDMREELPGARQGMQNQRSVETSAIANSKAAELQLDSPGWYREMRTLKWVWQGLDPLLLQEVQARIAISANPRTNEKWLDTVIGFRPGNWAYEWSQEAALLLQQAHMRQEQGEQEEARRCYMRASLLYTIASYPHIRGDRLSTDAHVLANKCYCTAAKYTPGHFRVLHIPYHGKTVQCYLHLPHTDSPLPVVIMSGGGDGLQTDFYRAYKAFWEPKGIAMLTLDMPGIGYCQQWDWQQNTAELHVAILDYLRSVPWVDSRRVAMVGMRMGGNSAVRAAYLKPNALKAVVAIGAPLHDALTQSDLMQHLSQMKKDEMACRLGLDSASETLLQAHLATFSLRTQGLLAVRRCKVPMLAITHPRDHLSTERDANLLVQSSLEGEKFLLPRSNLYASIELAHRKTADWVAGYL